MPVWLTIAQNDLKLFLRDKAGYVWLFIMPVVFIYFFGIAFRFDSSEKKTVLWIDNQDQGIYGKCFLAELEDKGELILEPKPQKKEEDLESVSLPRLIVIPEDFSVKIQAGTPVTIQYLLGKKGNTESNQLVQIRLVRAIASLISHLIEIESNSKKNFEQLEDYQQFVQSRTNRVILNISSAGSQKKMPSGFHQALPGTLVLFLLLNLFIYGGTMMAQERQSGVMKRLAVYPISRRQIIVGKIAGRVLLAAVQIFYFFLLAKFLFKVSLGNDKLALGCILLAYSWACASFSVLLGAFVTNPEKITGLGVLLGNLMGALGGCWWPLEIVPDFMKTLGHLFPTAWAMDALHQLISFGGSFERILTELTVLSAFALGATFLASRVLRYSAEP